MRRLVHGFGKADHHVARVIAGPCACPIRQARKPCCGTTNYTMSSSCYRARLEYPPPRKGPRQCGFSPYRAARPSAHGGLRRHFATRYGAPAASSVGQNGSQDLEIATGGGDPAGARAFAKRPQRGRFVCPIAGPGRRPPPRPCRRDRRPAPRARVHPRRAHLRAGRSA